MRARALSCRCVDRVDNFTVGHVALTHARRGSARTGKTQIIKVLADSLSLLKKHNVTGANYQKVECIFVNPKARAAAPLSA